MEKELEKKLDDITRQLKRLQLPWWKALMHGFITSVGSIIGVVFAIALLGVVASALDIPNKIGNKLNSWLDTKIQATGTQFNPQNYFKK
ncbi:MAG TPA: hypothetical protein VEA59_02505 [Patescibacteria group bacterium]|nr:hypothetical protein [Patescibacteria group bacterium]